MKKIRFATFITLLIITATSCNNTTQPKVIYDDTHSDTLNMQEMLQDTSKILVAGMPILLDSTNVLIHPIGWDDIYVNHNRKFESDSRLIDKMSNSKQIESYESYSAYTNEKDFIRGKMINLIFEDLKTQNQRKLTDKALVITNITYLKDIAKQIDKHYLLYTIYDKDYNRDGKLDGYDMAAYYMSNLDGTNFTKITQDYHYLDVTTLILTNSKYYFRTIEDVNKDGEFNKKDQYHYYYVDLLSNSLEPIEYYPLKTINIAGNK